MQCGSYLAKELWWIRIFAGSCENGCHEGVGQIRFKESFVGKAKRGLGATGGWRNLEMGEGK